MNIHILIEDKLIYYQDIFSDVESQSLFDKIKQNVEWNQDEILLFGKKVKIPRLSSWQADEGISYKYSGLELHSKVWGQEVKQIKNLAEKITNSKFNSVLLNYYRNGADSMGWHSDDEKELGLNPIIASVTLGEARKFQIREKINHSQKMEINLENGSLLFMSGNFQSVYQHSVPKTTKQIGERINLTFRKIIG